MFADFIRAAACRSGQMLNLHDIAGDVGVSDDTAKRWMKELEKSGIVFFLHPYSNNLLKRTIKTPKMYFFDTGLVSYLTRYSSSEILMNGAINGAILENYVVSEIIKTYSCLLYTSAPVTRECAVPNPLIDLIRCGWGKQRLALLQFVKLQRKG